MSKEQQKKHIIDMMEKDQELGLYDIFNDEKRQGVKDLIDAHKQETLEEAVNAFKKTDVYVNEIKQKQERMYSEEEVLKLLIYCKNKFGGSGLEDYTHDDEVKEWFEQFKNK
jgi:hypothetical protein